jgi:hypothetical protein
MSLSGIESRGILARLGLVAVGLVLATAAFAGRAAGVTYEPEPPFCESTPVRDFLRHVPRSSTLEPQPDGSLGFGPPAIRMKPLPSFVVGEGRVGYELFLLRGARTAHPRWKVTTSLARYYWRANLSTTVDKTERHVRTVSRERAAGVFFDVAEGPAYYVVTADFESLSGRPLGHFRFYFRVVRPTRHARLALNSSTYRPESTVFARVENYGTLPVAYGTPYSIERLENGTWVIAPESPKGPWLLIGLFSPVGYSGPCNGFRIPPSMPAGTYRVAKQVEFSRLFEPARASAIHIDYPPYRRRTLTAEFQVTVGEFSSQ